jgi:lipopolysaccharide export system permease protein
MLRPLLLFASALLLLSFVNEEFLYPRSYEFVDQFKTSHLRKKKNKKNNSLHVLFLSDGSKIVFQKKIPKTEILFDVFWILSDKEMWHMKTFNLQNDNPVGTYADHLLQTNGLFVKKESFAEYKFKTFPKGPFILKGEEPSKDSLSLTQLYKKGYKNTFSTDKPTAFKAFLHKKVAVLFIPLLIVLALAPFCLTFSRNIKVFFVSLFALFGWIAFYTILESAYILGAQSYISPAWIVWGAFSPFCLFSLYKFVTLR